MSETTAVKRGPGRPAHQPPECKPIWTRLRPDLKAILVREAAARGRSLSAEIESRIERSIILDAAA
jgi:hypothetical protein